MNKKGIGEKMKSIKRIVACTMAGALVIASVPGYRADAAGVKTGVKQAKTKTANKSKSKT